MKGLLLILVLTLTAAGQQSRRETTNAAANPADDAKGLSDKVPDVYAMMILAFQVWPVTLFYLVAQALLFIHLGHGLASMFQTFGLRNHIWWRRIQYFARAASLAIFIGYAVIPVAIYLRVGIDNEYINAKKREAQSALTTAAVQPATSGKELPK